MVASFFKVTNNAETPPNLDEFYWFYIRLTILSQPNPNASQQMDETNEIAAFRQVFFSLIKKLVNLNNLAQQKDNELNDLKQILFTLKNKLISIDPDHSETFLIRLQRYYPDKDNSFLFQALNSLATIDTDINLENNDTLLSVFNALKKLIDAIKNECKNENTNILDIRQIKLEQFTQHLKKKLEIKMQSLKQQQEMFKLSGEINAVAEEPFLLNISTPHTDMSRLPPFVHSEIWEEFAPWGDDLK